MLSRKELTEWTTALRANPEQQIAGRLTTDGLTGFCCLGKLCQIQNLQPVEVIWFGDKFLGYGDEKNYLPPELGEKFGHPTGNFKELGMPDMSLGGKSLHSASHANDVNISWLQIADHFDKYYPCSD